MASTAAVDTKLVEHGKFKIIIMEAPQETTIPAYVKELKAYGTTDVVRICEQTYRAEDFENEGIRVHDLPFTDGGAPPDNVIDAWNGLISATYRPKDPKDAGMIAVHCLAGLGRAPLLAAIALIETEGMDYVDAVEKVREKQNGAINAKQLKYLQAYKRTTPPSTGCCSVM